MHHAGFRLILRKSISGLSAPGSLHSPTVARQLTGLYRLLAAFLNLDAEKIGPGAANGHALPAPSQMLKAWLYGSPEFVYERKAKAPGYATRPPVSRTQSENESLGFQRPIPSVPVAPFTSECRDDIRGRRISSVTRNLKRMLTGEAVESSSLAVFVPTPEGESAKLHTSYRTALRKNQFIRATGRVARNFLTLMSLVAPHSTGAARSARAALVACQ